MEHGVGGGKVGVVEQFGKEVGEGFRGVQASAAFGGAGGGPVEEGVEGCYVDYLQVVGGVE